MQGDSPDLIVQKKVRKAALVSLIKFRASEGINVFFAYLDQRFYQVFQEQEGTMRVSSLHRFALLALYIKSSVQTRLCYWSDSEKWPIILADKFTDDYPAASYSPSIWHERYHSDWVAAFAQNHCTNLCRFDWFFIEQHFFEHLRI